MILHLGPKERICWWVHTLGPNGSPDGITWLDLEPIRLSFRLGIELNHEGRTDSFGLDHGQILHAVESSETVTNKQLFRWWHRTLSNKGAVQLRFHWSGWRPWVARDRAVLWNFFIDWLHLKLNPKGEGCTCWSDS